MSSQDYTRMDYATAYAALAEWVQTDPARSAIWTDLVEGGQGELLMGMSAFGMDQLSTYMESRVRELYLDTAEQDESILRRAKAEGYPIPGPTAASVDVTVNIGTPAPVALVLPAITLSVEGHTWTYLGGDVIPAGQQSVVVTFQQGSWRTITQAGTGEAYQEVAINAANVADGSIAVTVDGAAWEAVESTAVYGFDGEVFETYRNEEGKPRVKFGTGVSGKAPAEVSQVRTTYMLTDGAEGGVGSGAFTGKSKTWTASEDGQSYTADLSNAASSTAGSTIPGASVVRTNLKEWKRAVKAATTETSFRAEVLAYVHPTLGRVTLCQPRVMWANAHGNHVRIYVAVRASQYALTTAPTALKEGLVDHLETRKGITTQLDVWDVSLVDTDLSIRVKALPGTDEDTLEAAVVAAMRTQFDVDHIAIGTDVALSDLYRILEGLTGLDWAVITSHSDNITATDGEALQLQNVAVTFA